MPSSSSSAPQTSAPPDLATAFSQALTALQKAVEAKPDTDRLVGEMVRLCGAALRAGGAGVWVTESPDKPELTLEHNLAALQLLVEGIPSKGVMAGVRRCGREGKPLIVPPFFTEQDAGAAYAAGRPPGSAAAMPMSMDAPINPSPFELLYVPMRLNGKVGLVLVMAVAPPPAHDPLLHRTYLNFLSRMVGTLEQSLTQRHLNLVEKDRGTSNKMVRFAEQVHKHLFLGQVAADISNLARDILEADRVSVELYPRLKKKVLAVSNVDEPNKRGNIMQVQRLLFDYVRDRQAPVVIDREAARQLVSDPTLQDAATAYFTACEFDAFLLAPIKADDPTSPVLGVLLVEYATTQRAQANTSLLAEVAKLSTGSVANAIDVETVPLIKPFFAARKLWRKPTAGKRAMALSITAVVLLAILVIGVIPFDFSIKADCAIRPSAQLMIVAPLEERIVDIPVRAGEHVYPKDKQAALGSAVKPLAVLDSTELVAQRAEAVGKMGALSLQLKEYEKKGDSNKIADTQQQIGQEQTEIDLLEHQIDQCTVWSPIEGTVLTENVEQKRWSTPKKSEPLMEVASFSDWELVVDVPESEVAEVRAALDAATKKAAIDGRTDQGVDVDYILKPWPETKYTIQARGTATLLPASQQSNNANVFRLQVKLDEKSLPPGIAMSGVTGRAKVHVGTKPLAAQWLRGAIRLLKMTLFF